MDREAYTVYNRGIEDNFITIPQTY